jgi:zinc protease
METMFRSGVRAGRRPGPGVRTRLAALAFACTCAFAAAAAPAAAPATPATPPWPRSLPGFEDDPDWIRGRLENGLRYAVRHHPEPAGRISYRLAVEVGTAHERPGEEGFAHFVEHMAFNGTRRFPGETLRSELEKRGVSPGPDSNAFTSLTHTLYQFDVPGNGPADLAWFTQLLREFCDGLLFESRQVKRERAVIEAEIRERSGPAARHELMRRMELYPGSRLATPLLVLAPKSTPEQLRAFHRRWYRPDRAIVVVVGDAPAAALEAAVRAAFGGLPAPAEPPPAFSPGELGNPPASSTRLWHDAGVGGLWLELVSLAPPPPDGPEARRRELAAGLATYVLTERLGVIVRSHPGTIGNAGAHLSLATPFAHEANVFIQVNSTAWELAARTVVQELRRSLEFTLHPGEIADAKLRITRAAELAAAAAGTTASAALATGAVLDALHGRATLSPGAQLAFLRSVLPEIDPREIAGAWRSFWQPGRVRTFGYGFFTGPEVYGLMNRALDEESRRALQPPPRPPPVEFAYQDFGPPAVVRTRHHDAATDLHLVEFGNGVRVAYKRTEFAANAVDVAATFGDGLRTVPPQLPALAPLARTAFLGGGLGRHSTDQLRRLLAAEPVSLDFTVAEAGFVFTGSSPPARLDLLLRLICAYLTDPGWSAEAFTAAGTSLVGSYFDALRTPEGVMALHAFTEASHGDARLRTPLPAEVAGVSLDVLRGWLNMELRRGPLDLALVGDLDPAALEPLLAATVGSLPPRDPNPPTRYPFRFRKQAHTADVKLAPHAPRSVVQLLWPAGQGATVSGSRRLEVLAAAFGNRVVRRVREEKGATYSPNVGIWTSQAEPEDGYLTAFALAAPNGAGRLARTLLAEADAAAERGFTPEEFAAAVNPVIAHSRVQLRSNSYWLWNIALAAHRRPEVLAWPATRTSEFEAMRVEEINALAREVLRRDRAQRFRAEP